MSLSENLSDISNSSGSCNSFVVLPRFPSIACNKLLTIQQCAHGCYAFFLTQVEVIPGRVRSSFAYTSTYVVPETHSKYLRVAIVLVNKVI